MVKGIIWIAFFSLIISVLLIKRYFTNKHLKFVKENPSLSKDLKKENQFKMAGKFIFWGFITMLIFILLIIMMIIINGDDKSYLMDIKKGAYTP